MKTARPIPPEVLAAPGLHDRLISRIVVRDAGYATECWESTYTRHKSGYARMVIHQKLWRVHRVAYELWVGPIPAGFVLDHLCRNTVCINPDHLEAVTQAENTARGNNRLALTMRAFALKTHCVRGHEFTPENTATYDGHRQCRACGRERYREKSAARGKVVTPRRSRASVATHCANGHEWTEENTYVSPKGGRQCRACNREAARRYKERRAA